MNQETSQAFRVGGYYREQSGALIRLDALIAPPPEIRHFFKDTVPVLVSKQEHRGGAFFESGWRRLSDGRYQYEMDDDASLYHLIPGELTAQGEPIAPTFYCAAETIKPAIDWDEVRAANVECITAMLREVKAQAVVRQQADLPDGWSLIGYDRGTDKFVIRTNEPVAEKLRPRLTWADSKAADRFPGFSSSSDTATPDHAYSHPLTRVADAGAQVAPASGSAWLVVR